MQKRNKNKLRILKKQMTFVYFQTIPKASIKFQKDQSKM